MARYSEQTINDVNKYADIRDIIPGTDPTKPRQQLDCPFCGAKKKFSVVHNSKSNSAWCYVCKEGFGNPISAWMHYQGYDKSKYTQAIEEVAKLANVQIYTEEQKRKDTIKEAGESMRSSFCAMQLAASGLTVEDVMTTVNDGRSEYQCSPFQPGSFGPKFSFDPKGSDMIIYYYDLHGRQMTYTPKGSSALRQYGRVRHYNPELHRDKNDKPTKYRTPAGASCRAYITNLIRVCFKNKTHIDTLFLQEGEKKAEKACKHGMPSIGIQGITNFGSMETGLLQDIQDIVKVCTVKNVVLMMDSDWSDLHSEISVGESVDKRPNSFAAAVIKFKQFMASFRNLKLDVETWWGHVNDNPSKDKGIDDLLCGTLKCHEEELIQDAEYAMNTHNGKGKYVTIVKISTLSDMKIRDLWFLNDHQAFFSHHEARLSSVGSFRIGGIRYKVENGKMLAMSRYSSEFDIYSIEESETKGRKVSLNFTETLRYLEDSGFYRILNNPDDPESGYSLIHIDDGIIDKSAPYQVRDFVADYIMKNTKDQLVHDYFNFHLDSILSDKKLERLSIAEDKFTEIKPLVQNTTYNNGMVEITPDSITPGKPINNVWRSKIVPRNFKRVPLLKIKNEDGNLSIEYTPEADKCDFLQYLINTSNNFYPHHAPRATTPEEDAEWCQHLLNKITALGYLLSDWKPANERKAVVIQDHRMSEVGQSHGGVGKSIIGNAIGKIIPQVTIAGTTFKKDDQFVFSSVTRATRNIFIDDINANFHFKHLFPMVTGDMEVNPKQAARFTIKLDESPKFLITTNHTINGSTDDSVARRIIYMEFSSWYSRSHTPVNDFHRMFFYDWDDEHWNLFDNLMAECVMYYFRSYSQQWTAEGTGVIPPPMKQIELRSLRQEMSESFLQWAEEYYDPSGFNLNERQVRLDIFRNFLDYAGPTGHGVTRTNIRKKIEAYCKFKGLDLNINKPNDQGSYYNEWKQQHPAESFIGDTDKAGGKEYFTVWSPTKPPTATSLPPI